MYKYVVVIVVVGATNVLKVTERERVTAEGRLFQGTLETAVKLCQW